MIKKQFLLMLITLLFALILAGGTSAANEIWVNDSIDVSGYNNQYSSIAIDSAGNPHILYSNPEVVNTSLKYAYKDNSGWHNQTIDDGVWGANSITLDNLGRPHISYTKSISGHSNIRYAYFDGSVWQIEDAIADGTDNFHSSLALDSAGYPHISYTSWEVLGTMNNLYLKYAYKDGSGWHIENAETVYSGLTNYASSLQGSLALDSSGNPHISYTNPINLNLRYAYKNSSGWHFEDVEYLGSDPSLELDSSNNPHIIYSDNAGHLRYASRSSGIWNIETVESPGIAIYSPSLDLDSNDDPHIVYYSGILKYATRSGGSWVIEPLVGILGGTVYTASLALDSSDNPNISFSAREIINDFSIYHLMYAYLSNSTSSVDPTQQNDPKDSADQFIGSSSIEINAADTLDKTVGMQKTGVPLISLVMAVLLILGGLVYKK